MAEQPELNLDDLAGQPSEADNPEATPKTEEPQQAKPSEDYSKLNNTIAQQQEALQRQQQQMQQLQALLQRNNQSANPIDPDVIKQRFYEDPLSFLQASNQQTAQQVYQRMRMENYHRDMNLAKRDARDSDPELFDKYRSEIEQVVQQKYDPQHHTNSETWKVAFNEIKGQHAEEVAKHLADKRTRAQNAGPSGPTVRGAQEKAKEGLTDDEKYVADNVFFMSNDQYKTARDSWQKQGEKLHPRSATKDALASPWAKYMTFDSRLQRDRLRKNNADRQRS